MLRSEGVRVAVVPERERVRGVERDAEDAAGHVLRDPVPLAVAVHREPRLGAVVLRFLALFLFDLEPVLARERRDGAFEGNQPPAVPDPVFQRAQPLVGEDATVGAIGEDEHVVFVEVRRAAVCVISVTG